ncbi:MAG: hypothetical protein GY947_20260 [Rhodobacteraceae bacterium]|nr:hypothetical protein [Paracoccaceae bacterium]
MGKKRVVKSYALATWALALLLRLSTSAVGEEMQFFAGGHDARCTNCAFVQAVGTITKSTPEAFARFLKKHDVNFVPKSIRLHSSGGDLAAGIKLGETFRALGFATEVGSDREIANGKEVCSDEEPRLGDICLELHPYFGGRTSVRKPGVCASACAYAFLGGVERVIVSPSKLGFHRFRSVHVMSRPLSGLFAGMLLDEAQKETASLVLYAMKMGVDAHVVAGLAAEAGAGEMHWVSDNEASEFNVRYQPSAWKPWRLETDRGGVIARSDTYNGRSSMLAYCERDGQAYVELRDRNEDWDIGYWFEQNRTCPIDGKHTVFGELVSPDNTSVRKGKGGRVTMRFQLPTRAPKLTSPALFDDNIGAYPTACSTIRYGGTMQNFKAAVDVAMKACLSR